MLLIRQLRAITDPACLKRVHTHVGMIRCSKPSAVLLSTQSCMKQLVLYKHLGMTRIHAMVVHVGLGFSQDFSESPKLSCSTDRTCKCLWCRAVNYMGVFVFRWSPGQLWDSEKSCEKTQSYMYHHCMYSGHAQVFIQH